MSAVLDAVQAEATALIAAITDVQTYIKTLTDQLATADTPAQVQAILDPVVSQLEGLKPAPAPAS